MKKTGKFHYAWVILFFALISAFVYVGLCTNTLSLYIKPVSDANGFTRGSFSLKNTLASLIAGCLTLSYSKITERFPLKGITAFGICCFMINYSIQAVAKSLPLFYLSAVFQGLGMGTASMTAMNILVNRWFSARIGTMTSIMYTATSIGGAIFFPLLGNMVTANGYQGGFWLSVGILGVYLVILLLLLVDEPRKKGLQPKYAELVSEKEVKSLDDVPGLTFEEVLKAKSFWPSVVLIFLISICSTAMQGTMTARLQDVGFELAFATGIASILYIFTSGAKIPAGIIADKKGILPVINFALVVAIGALLCLLFADPSRVWVSYLMTPLMGMSMILHTIPAPLLGPTIYGRRAIGKYMGIYMAATTFGGAVGNSLWNYLYDASGSYNSSYIICITVFALCIVGFTVLLKSQKVNWLMDNEKKLQEHKKVS